MKTRLLVLALFVSWSLGQVLYGGEQKRYAIVGENLPAVEQEMQLQGGKKIHNFRYLKGFAAYLSEAQAQKLQEKFGSKITVTEDEFMQVLQGKPGSGQSTEWGISAVKAPQAWATTRGAVNGVGVNVAIVDTGIDKDHPDLAANIVGGENVMPDRKGNVNRLAYDDDNNHGSHVAGIVAAVDNGIGVVGVAPEAKIIAIKAIDSRGQSTNAILADGVLAAAAYSNCRVINMSWHCSWDYPLPLKAAISTASASGIVLVAAAGNDGGTTPVYPANSPYVIAVGAIDSNFNVPDWSDGGPEYVAPGVGVRSTGKSGNYLTWDGTSMASPHVAGVAALMIASQSAGMLADPIAGIPVERQGGGLINALSTVQHTALVGGRSRPSATERMAAIAHAAGPRAEQPFLVLHSRGQGYSAADTALWLFRVGDRRAAPQRLSLAFAWPTR